MPQLRHKTIASIYTIPVLIALIVSAGLTSALLGDGAWDVLSWITLLIPAEIFAIGWINRDK